MVFFERTRGLPAAQAVQALIENLSLELVEASRDLILDAAHIKAFHALSNANAFAVASAMRESAIILTGDPEYQMVDDLVKVEWLIRQTFLKGWNPVGGSMHKYTRVW